MGSEADAALVERGLQPADVALDDVEVDDQAGGVDPGRERLNRDILRRGPGPSAVARTGTPCTIGCSMGSHAPG